MASKFRPSGSISDLLSLTAEQVFNLSNDALSAIVSKLNDAANKRMKRLSQSKISFLSPTYRERKGQKFTLPEKRSLKGLSESEKQQANKELQSDLRIAYAEARTFLKLKTSTLRGTKKYNKGFQGMYEKFLDAKKDYDKRYKSKKVIKSSGKKKIRSFWEQYEQWREINMKNNPDAYKGGTNKESVQYFEQHIYSKGKTSIKDMEKKAKEDYKKQEEGQLENEQGESVSTPSVNGEGTRNIKHPKQQKRGTIKTKFEKIKIF